MTCRIAVFNQAGGVAKTTLTINLGYHLAQLGQKVLLVDLDPQSSLTIFMGLEPLELEQTIYDSLLRKVKLPIHHNIYNMDVVPANILLSKAEIELVMATLREYRLQNVLAQINNQYDFILIDCPPSLGLLSILALNAASHVLIPIQAEYKALRGTELLLQTFSEVKEETNPDLAIAGIIPTMYTRTTQGERSLESIAALSEIGKIFDPIPRATDFANAAEEHIPLALYKPKHPTINVLKKIASNLCDLV